MARLMGYAVGVMVMQAKVIAMARLAEVCGQGCECGGWLVGVLR